MLKKHCYLSLIFLVLSVLWGCSDHPNSIKINEFLSDTENYSFDSQLLNETIHLSFEPKKYLSKESMTNDKAKYHKHNTTLVVESIEEREKEYYVFIKIEHEFSENSGTIVTPSSYTLSNGSVEVASSLHVKINVDGNSVQATTYGYSTDRIGFGIEKDILENAEIINVQIQNMNIFNYARK